MELTQQQKETIQKVYRQWLKNNNYKPRRSQREMIAVVSRFLAAVPVDNEGYREDDYHDNVSLIEAGTGTGKTIGYTLPAIFLALELDKKLVISTATVNLQEQLVDKDLPDIAKNSGLVFDYSIAKGRQRYLCKNKITMRVQDATRKSSDIALFPDEESSLSEAAIARFGLLDQAFQVNEWDGDKDSLTEIPLEDEWRLIAADSASCSGKKCKYYVGCALFQARDRVRKADIIVANHDLVLADLSAGGGNILPSPEDSIYVFDEAHHLPDKSRNHRSLSLSISGELKNLVRAKALVGRIAKIKDAPADCKDIVSKLIRVDEGLEILLQEVKRAIQAILFSREDGHDGVDYRFKHGVVPEELKECLAELGRCFALKQLQLKKLYDLIVARQEADGEIVWSAQAAMLGQNLQLLDNAIKLSENFGAVNCVTSAPSARWVSANDNNDIRLHSLPLSAAAILKEVLWQKCFATILTSATLASLGSFDNYLASIGYSNKEHTHRLVGQLNFQQAVFHVPKMSSDPRMSAEHTEELIDLIPQLIHKSAGTLVLFSSRKQMEAVNIALRHELLNHLLVQGELAKASLIRKHKEAIDGGEKSIIFGLASFAEGIDLPGPYCEQVIIAKLPFAAPDTPAEEAMGEWIELNGGHSFRDLMLPAAAVRLMQASGRLLRNDSDTGRVSLLDSRIVHKHYGKALLASLPPFTFDLNY